MTVMDLLNTAKENYEMAMEFGGVYSISNVIRCYETFSNLYHLNLITNETFDKYFNAMYTMANNVCTRYMQNDEKMNKKVKTIIETPFGKIIKERRYETCQLNSYRKEK